MLFFPIQHVLKRSKTVTVIWQAVNVCFKVHFNTEMNRTEECGEKYG